MTQYIFNDWYASVRDFMSAVGQDIPDGPVVPELGVILRRYDMLKEELLEWFQAASEGDLVAMADAISDLIYVAIGADVESGIDTRKVFRLVHDANMKKLDGPKREDGKQLKPEGWIGPERKIADVLDV